MASYTDAKLQDAIRKASDGAMSLAKTVYVYKVGPHTYIKQLDRVNEQGVNLVAVVYPDGRIEYTGAEQ